MHFTPTYSSWLNHVERWFALLNDKKLRRGAHRSIQALEEKTSEIGSQIGTTTPEFLNCPSKVRSVSRRQLFRQVHDDAKHRCVEYVHPGIEFRQ